MDNIGWLYANQPAGQRTPVRIILSASVGDVHTNSYDYDRRESEFVSFGRGFGGRRSE